MMTMKRRAAVTAALLALGAGLAGAPSASAAGFCTDQHGSGFVQWNFSSGGNVVATLCGPSGNRSGTAYFHSRGQYAGVKKYMKMEIQTLKTAGGVDNRQVDGDYLYSIYRAVPAGGHTYSVVMYNGNGTRIVNEVRRDYS